MRKIKLFGPGRYKGYEIVLIRRKKELILVRDFFDKFTSSGKFNLRVGKRDKIQMRIMIE